MKSSSVEPPRQLLAKVDVLDHLTSAVLVCDGALQVRYMNPAAEGVFRTSEQHSMGAVVNDLLYNDDSTAFADLRDIFASGQSITKRAAVFRIRDGTEVVADLTASLELLSNHLVIELQPINRLLRINRDDHSVFSQQTTRELVRGLAHEIKNPLGGLRGAAQLLERELGKSELTEYTHIIIEEADRLTELVDRMLGPNRKPQIEEVNVHEALEHVMRLVDAELAGQIEFVRDYDPSLPNIRADSTQLVQALLNILRNAGQALQHTRRPRISLKTRVVRQFTIGSTLHRLVAQIDITDNGPGIPEEMLDRIWFPMISGRPNGTGLGLAITQAIIGQHNGMIECTSRPGETCFSVFLPFGENPDPSSSAHGTGIDNDTSTKGTGS
ncbi:MAG: nitrogen regulation protein NR(II) [Gammaproteobacteria bacterium]|nr:nitrogen regulation protein NR(II) [Gammaproteobacteria bacterium]